MIMNNIILIGMPGVGKSTVGVVLAKTLGYAFLDSDLYNAAAGGNDSVFCFDRCIYLRLDLIKTHWQKHSDTHFLILIC